MKIIFWNMQKSCVTLGMKNKCLQLYHQTPQKIQPRNADSFAFCTRPSSILSSFPSWHKYCATFQPTSRTCTSSNLISKQSNNTIWHVITCDILLLLFKADRPRTKCRCWTTLLTLSLLNRDDGNSDTGTSLPLVQIHLSLLADEVRKSAPNPANGCKGKHDLLLAIDVGVENTQNVLEIVLGHERLHSTVIFSITWSTKLQILSWSRYQRYRGKHDDVLARTQSPNKTILNAFKPIKFTEMPACSPGLIEKHPSKEVPAQWQPTAYRTLPPCKKCTYPHIWAPC